ncbi:putative mediator of RNA polymerase II transcription subunit 26b [Canna indica]|uniref:Mediator of RNA polymerase II transcription subunit 26b n=1 Tax=Canna indica TaxID=4628 RepID=A0AAQ3KWL0_9LILI|nr:putative mediator of RNA polymerase II transcription subunit 26b [Canna indica]
MGSSSGSVDYWRRFFRTADADIFEVMEQAILVASSDYPQEFRSRRDRIVEKFFTALLPRCFGCDRLELQGAEGEEGRGSVRRVGEKESKVDSSNDALEFSNRVASNYTYDEAEALTEEIEEEGQIVGEVLRLKEILANQHDESDNILFESLRRLQLMELSVDVLKATEIGRAVNGLRKHNSKQIRHLVRTLIDGWKVLVDEWVSASACIAGNSPDSLNPSVVDDEEGLPSPPLDEGALFAAQTTSIQLSGFFDGMDDDGNFRNNTESYKKRENGRRPTENYGTVKKQEPVQQSVILEKQVEMKRQEAKQSIFIEDNMRKEAWQPGFSEEKLNMRRQETETWQFKSHNQDIPSKQSKPVIAESGPGRPAKLTSERIVSSDTKPKLQQDTAKHQRKPPMIPQDKPKFSEEASVRAKLEIAKRKLHEGYQQAENAKKQRTIQVMELHDIPKQTQNNRQPFLKSRNHFRNNWVNGRH